MDKNSIYHSIVSCANETSKLLNKTISLAKTPIFLARDKIYVIGNSLSKISEGVKTTSLVAYHQFQSLNQMFIEDLSRSGLIYKGIVSFGLGVLWHEDIAYPLYSSLNNMGFNQYQPLPEPIIGYRKQINELNYALARNGTFWERTIISQTFHGSIYFGLIQEVLLRKTPELILKRFAPSHVHLVNHKVAKLARICLGALAHTFGYKCLYDSPWIHLPFTSNTSIHDTQAYNILNFIRGIWLGTIQEISGNPLYPIAALAGINMTRSIIYSKDILQK